MITANLRSGFDRFTNVFSNCSDNFKDQLEIKFEYKEGIITFDESMFSTNKIDVLFLNLLYDTENTCNVIRKVKELSPETKIIFTSSAAYSISNEVFLAGAIGVIYG